MIQRTNCSFVIALTLLIMAFPLADIEAQGVDEHLLSHLTWRSVGPTRGGRVLGVAGHSVDKLVFYQGSAGGGVWKTEDAGANWKNGPVLDQMPIIGSNCFFTG